MGRFRVCGGENFCDPEENSGFAKGGIGVLRKIKRGLSHPQESFKDSKQITSKTQESFNDSKQITSKTFKGKS